MHKFYKWYQLNVQCDKHGECDWIVKFKDEADALKTMGELVNCEGCSKGMTLRELTEEEAHKAIFETFFADPPIIAAMCLWS